MRRVEDILVAVVAVVTVLPMLPVVLWAVAGAWRYPALLPPELSTRGLRLLLGDGHADAFGQAARPALHKRLRGRHAVRVGHAAAERGTIKSFCEGSCLSVLLGELENGGFVWQTR